MPFLLDLGINELYTNLSSSFIRTHIMAHVGDKFIYNPENSIKLAHWPGDPEQPPPASCGPGRAGDTETAWRSRNRGQSEMGCESSLAINSNKTFLKLTTISKFLLTFQVMSRNFERNLNNLQHTCLMVNQEKLVHLFLLNAKEVCCFLLQLAKLHVLRYRELAGYRSVIWLLWTVDDDLLGRGNIGRDQDGGINLGSKLSLISYWYCCNSCHWCVSTVLLPPLTHTLFAGQRSQLLLAVGQIFK